MIPQNPQLHQRKTPDALHTRQEGVLRKGARMLRTGRLPACLALLATPPSSVTSQVVKPPTAPNAQAVVVASSCDLLARPMEFNGQHVQVTGTVQAGLDDFLLRADGCTGVRRDAPLAVWIDLPEGSRAKVGPAIRTVFAVVGSAPAPSSTVHLVRNDAWKNFDDSLTATFRSVGSCLGCVANTATATLTGWVEAVDALPWQKDGQRFTRYSGFGNLNAYRVRLVLEQVTDVTPHPVNYGAAANALAMASPSLPPGDAERLLQSASETFANGTAAYGQLRRAGVAFGSKADRNGILMRPLPPNERRAGEQTTGASSSTDGLIAYVDYDPNRLTPDGLVRALAIEGSALADVREARSRPALVELDGHGVQTLLLLAAATGMRSLTLPGGAVLWQSVWPETERKDHVTTALALYLGRWKVDVPPRLTTAPAGAP